MSNIAQAIDAINIAAADAASTTSAVNATGEAAASSGPSPVLVVAGGAVVVAVVGTGVGAFVLYSKTIPRPKGQNQDLVNQFADPEKMAGYRAKLEIDGVWLDNQATQDLYVTSYDGLRLHASYLPAATPSNKVVILHHGFTGKPRENAIHAKYFHDRGYEVLLLDMRAHGLSEGKYVGFGILDRHDTLAWVNEARQRFGQDVKIVLHGTSMGAATVLMSLGLPEVQEHVSAAVADCAFTSPSAIFSHVIREYFHIPITAPIIKANGIITKATAGYSFDDYSTLEALKTNKVPVLFVHGKADKFVPLSMGNENFEACTSKKQQLLVDDAGHGGSVMENRELYESTESSFLGELGL